MSALARLLVFVAWWLAVDAVLAALWAAAGWRRAGRGPVQYGSLPVPLVPYVRMVPGAELLAVDGPVSWSYAETVGFELA